MQSVQSHMRDEVQRSQLRAGLKSTLARIHIHTDEVIKESAHCEGVVPASPQAITRRWRQAAMGGHLPSMTQYAVGNAFRLNETLHNLDALAVYKGEAEAFARRAAEAGDMKAIAALAAAYSPFNEGGNRTYLAQVVRPNGVESLALLLRLRDALDNTDTSSNPLPRHAVQQQVQRLSAALQPQQRAQAQARAVEGVAVSLPATGIDISPLMNGTLTDITRNDCSDSQALLR